MLRIPSLLRAEYVFPEVGEVAATALSKRADAHAYDAPLAPLEFATSITRELVELTRDKHVRVRFAPATAGAGTPRERDPSVDNFGVHRLPNRIAYLKIDRFYGADESRASFDAALTLVAPASALIGAASCISDGASS